MSQSSSETYMVGFVICNIVGLQHYTGTINGREMVGLVREPLNPFDKNAIKVINTRSLQVGHIERSVAAVLSPLMDNRTIRVEGIVPNTGRSGNRHKIPIQIHVFARLEMFDTIKSCFSRGKLQLISGDDVSFGLSEAMVVKEKKAGKADKSLDDIFKSLDDKKTKIVAMEPPKEVIKSELFLHQKEGLGWLFQRENSEDLPPFWEEKNRKFFNLLTNYTSDIRPEPLRGGFFADDMGLGKTLTLLSLIALDKCTTFKRSLVGSNSSDLNMVEEISKVEDRLISSSTKKRKMGRVSEKGTGRKKQCKTEDTHVDGNLKGKSVDIFDDSPGDSCKKMTLIVCPPSVFSTWITQLEEHTVPGMLKTYMFYGNNTTTDLEEIKKYDVVLTTYSTLTMDSRSQNHVKNMEWWRVILDEAHAIKNVNSQQSRAVTALKAKRRWVVTGTPIQNSSFDLFSMMAFLNFEPFSIKSYWKILVQRPREKEWKPCVVLVLPYYDLDLVGAQTAFVGIREIKCAFQQILKGVAAMHERQMMHRDLKPANLLMKNGEIVIADMGMTTTCNPTQPQLPCEVITLWYRPPELVFGSTKYGQEVDVWSCGILFAELMTRKSPFPGKSEHHQMELILETLGTQYIEESEGIEKLPFFAKMMPKRQLPKTSQLKRVFASWPEDALDLLSKMMCPVKSRATVAELLAHPFFANHPHACLPEEIPRVQPLHEFEVKQRHNNIQSYHPRPEAGTAPPSKKHCPSSRQSANDITTVRVSKGYNGNVVKRKPEEKSNWRSRGPQGQVKQ